MYTEMDSFEEDEKLVQMVQDFIESDSDSSSTVNYSYFSAACSNHHSECLLALRDILDGDEFQRGIEREVMERVEKHLKKGRKDREDQRASGMKKWLALRLKMDGFAASLCHTSWGSSFACPAGDYEYIDVLVKDKSGDDQDTIRLILDLDFRSQFELARPTETYKALTDALPPIFIGDETKLNGVISLLCAAAKQSLRERGMHIPPWRTTTYMQSKWLSPAGMEKLEPAPTPVGECCERRELSFTRQRKWVPPSGVKNKRRDLGSESGLSSQFSSMGINCC